MREEYDACPYCLADLDICHDDGYGYDEGEACEQDCGRCGKTFIYYTLISYNYDTCEAPCLNGDDHGFDALPTANYPDRRRCRWCQREELGTHRPSPVGNEPCFHNDGRHRWKLYKGASSLGVIHCLPCGSRQYMHGPAERKTR